MSFLDRFAKGVKEAVDKAAGAVSEAMDDSKEAMDRLARTNKLKGEIRDAEKLIEEVQAQIQAVKVQLGEKAMAMLQAGTLEDEELQGFLEQVQGFEQQIAEHKGVIAEKEAGIEEIKAEAEAEKQAREEAKAKAKAEAEAEAEAAAAPAAVVNACPQCGTAVPEGAAFCPNCGNKMS